MNSTTEYVPIVLFTGAGASCAKGIELPNMTQFFNQIMDKNHMPTDDFIRNKQYFKYVMDCMYPDKNQTQVYDLEKVLGTLYKLAGTFSDDSAFSILNEFTLAEKIGRKVNSVYSGSNRNGVNHPNQTDLFNAIGDTMTERYTEIKQSARDLLHDLQMIIRKSYSDVNLEGIYNVYGMLFRDLFTCSQSVQNETEQQIVLPVFTVNYDPSIDYVLESSAKKECIDLHKKWRNTVPNYMFANGFTKHEYGSYFVWRQHAFAMNCKDGVVVPYHKLHGSALWEKRDGEVMLTTDPVSDLSQMPREFNMIYPSDKTTPDEDPYSYSHLELDRYIRKTKVLIVIGFAFRDPGIVNVMSRGLRENPDLRIFVVGPLPNQWEKEFMNFTNHENVIHVEGYFGEKEVHEELISLVKENLKVKTEVLQK